MTVLQMLWHFIGSSLGAAARPAADRDVLHSDLAALRLYSLPRGIRQRSRACLLHV